MDAAYDVIVVGYGPVGTMLALLLKEEGMRTLVVSKEREIERYPRAAHFDDEIIRVYQAVGLAHLSEEMENPPRYQYFDKDWTPFLARLFPGGISDQGYQHDFMFFQPDLERAMRDRLSDGEGAPVVALGETVARVWQTDELAWVEVRDESGATKAYSAKWLIGCDGAASTVRKSIGSTFDQLAPSHKWYIVDVKLTDLAADPGMDQWEYCNPDRIVTYIPLSGPYRRYEFDVKDGETDVDLAGAERTWELLSPWLKPGEAIVLRNDIYRFHSLLASRWREGRLLIAGDAAHLMAPKLGQGLCNGIRDAANLAWKIGRVVRGEAAPHLLDSYEAERKGPARQHIEISAYLVSQIISKASGEEQSGEPVVEQIVAPRQVIGDDDLRAHDALAGTLSRQPMLANGRRMDDSVGYRFALLAMPSLAGALSASDIRALSALGAVVLRAEDRSLADYLTDIDRGALLVRPDRYIAGSARTSIELSAILEEARHAYCLWVGAEWLQSAFQAETEVLLAE